jgi:hypothetical protein
VIAGAADDEIDALFTCSVDEASISLTAIRPTNNEMDAMLEISTGWMVLMLAWLCDCKKDGQAWCIARVKRISGGCWVGRSVVLSVGWYQKVGKHGMGAFNFKSRNPFSTLRLVDLGHAWDLGHRLMYSFFSRHFFFFFFVSISP